MTLTPNSSATFTADCPERASRSRMAQSRAVVSRRTCSIACRRISSSLREVPLSDVDPDTCGASSASSSPCQSEPPTGGESGYCRRQYAPILLAVMPRSHLRKPSLCRSRRNLSGTNARCAAEGSCRRHVRRAPDARLSIDRNVTRVTQRDYGILLRAAPLSRQFCDRLLR